VELDNSSGGVNQQATTDLSNGGLDKSNTNINRPHIFVANEVFFLPKFASKGAFVQNTVGGWEVNSIITIETGASLSAFTGGASGACIPDTVGPNAGNCMTSNHLLNGPLFPGNGSTLNALIGTGFTSNNRPLVTGVDCNSGTSGSQVLNPAAFTLVGYHLGTVDPKMAARGVCFGPNARIFDLQFVKNWYFKEHFRLKFSIDAFNIFNHANFSTSGLQTGYNGNGLSCGTVAPCGKALNAAGTAFVPDLTNNVVTAGGGGTFGQTFGLIAGHESRELQYGLKLTF